MNPAKNPVADQTIVSVLSGVSAGSVAPYMKHKPVVIPPNAVTVLRTRNLSESQPVIANRLFQDVLAVLHPVDVAVFVAIVGGNVELFDMGSDVCRL